MGRARLQFGFATGTELEAMDAEGISIHRCDRKSDPELPALLNLKQCCADVRAFGIRILASSIEKQLVLDTFMQI